MEIYTHFEPENFGCLSLPAFGSPDFFVINQEDHRRKLTIHNCFSVKLRASWLLQTSTESKRAWTWSCNYCYFVQIQSYESSDLWSNQISKSNVFFNSATTYITSLFAYTFYAHVLWRFGYLILESLKSIFQTKMRLLVEKVKWILEKDNWLILSSNM